MNLLTHTHTHTHTPSQTYADQVRAMQVQFSRLVGYWEELAGNSAVGARDSITAEMKELQSEWSKLKDNVMDSLAMLQREYDDWVRRE